MKVSVVTISRDQGAFLERAMRSVIGQDHPDIDYIVVDAGSTDGSRDIVDRYRGRLAATVLDPDDGPADGLNRGLALATGELFGYVNADDMLLPGALARIAAAFAAEPRADVVYGHGYIDDRCRNRSYKVHGTAPMGRWRLAFGGAFILQQATFFRTEAVRAVGGFNVANRTCWDAELVADLLLAGRRFHRIDAELGVFTLHGASMTAGGLTERYHRDWAGVVAKLTGRGPRPVDGVYRHLARLLKWGGDPAALVTRLRAVIDRHQTIPASAPATTPADRRQAPGTPPAPPPPPTTA